MPAIERTVVFELSTGSLLRKPYTDQAKCQDFENRLWGEEATSPTVWNRGTGHRFVDPLLGGCPILHRLERTRIPQFNCMTCAGRGVSLEQRTHRPVMFQSFFCYLALRSQRSSHRWPQLRSEAQPHCVRYGRLAPCPVLRLLLRNSG